MKIINLTPHTIVIQSPNGTRLVYESVGVARVSSTPGALGTPDGFPCPVAAPTVFGAVEGIPDPQPGVVYIASMICAEKARRPDVLSPGTGPQDGAIRDGGQVVAVTRLISWT